MLSLKHLPMLQPALQVWTPDITHFFLGGVRCPLSKPELENDLKAMPITVLSFSTFSSDTLNVLFLLC